MFTSRDWFTQHDSPMVSKPIQCSKEERAQKALATSLTRAPRCSISMAVNFYRAFNGLFSASGAIHHGEGVRCSALLNLVGDLGYSAIDQIAQSGLSSLLVIYYSVRLPHHPEKLKFSVTCFATI